MRVVSNKLTQILIAGSLTLISTSAFAGTQTITFDDIGLDHGEIVNTQFAGVTISAENYSDGPDLAVAFDTTLSNTRDSDLEGPSWGNNNLGQFGINANTYVTGNALIIQENSYKCYDDNVCNRPDDEGSRPAGIVTFEFDTAISSLGFDLIDFQDVEVTGSNVTFFNDALESISYTFASFVGGVHNAVYGDNSLNRIMISSIGINNANKAVFDFGGSGAVDTIVYNSTTQVPEPGTLTLFGLALAGLFIRKARK